MFSHFRRQKGFAGGAIMPTVLEIEKNVQIKTMLSERKYMTTVSDVCICFKFWPHNFFLDITLKIPKIVKISKNGIHDIVILVSYRHAKFELSNSIFVKVMKKLLKIDDVEH